jgi:hypothetical protein
MPKCKEQAILPKAASMQSCIVNSNCYVCSPPLLQSTVTKQHMGLPKVPQCCPLLLAGCALLGGPAVALADCAGPADNISLQQQDMGLAVTAERHVLELARHACRSVDSILVGVQPAVSSVL